MFRYRQLMENIDWVFSSERSDDGTGVDGTDEIRERKVKDFDYELSNLSFYISILLGAVSVSLVGTLVMLFWDGYLNTNKGEGVVWDVVRWCIFGMLALFVLCIPSLVKEEKRGALKEFSTLKPEGELDDTERKFLELKKKTKAKRAMLSFAVETFPIVTSSLLAYCVFFHILGVDRYLLGEESRLLSEILLGVSLGSLLINCALVELARFIVTRRSDNEFEEREIVRKRTKYYEQVDT